ncbi:hypothetical protein LSH36_539g01020 [Paralvinella palmiformis]|uniref:Guanine nucleotide-binding protein subunit gamma n=1 Tax=Paralvinella palmiformis TaxID=53620 RepID=A0AAD9MXF9_9ANNE|nr:hypothetical protein LSH36_539g01020 [Paralvinella palmiformis]
MGEPIVVSCLAWFTHRVQSQSSVRIKHCNSAIQSVTVAYRQPISGLVTIIASAANQTAGMSNTSQQKKLVEQLRVEYAMSRVTMTESIKDLIAFTEEGKDHDPLIIGIDKKINPFIEKGGCSIL